MARAVVLATVIAALGCRDDAGHPAKVVTGGDPTRGRAAVARYGCGGCHVIPGIPGAQGRVGPPLTEFGERAYVAGRLPNAPEALVRWIRDPQAVSPGTAMPDLGVTEPHARDIAAYLYTANAGGLGPPHLFPERVLRGR
jgi:cytochrome c1